MPTAAVSEQAIATYVGDIGQILSKGTPNKALLVHAKPPPPVDDRLPIREMDGATIFHLRTQVWVHVDFTRYRSAYQRAFPTEELTGRVISHALNRRVAALKGFEYVRVTPVSRGANSSSGFTEKWSVALHGASRQSQRSVRHGASIQYADLADLMLMMDLKLGGGVMSVVNEGQALVKPRP